MWFAQHLVHIYPVRVWRASTRSLRALRSNNMKQLLRTTDMATIAFAQALLQGEGIDCFEMDVNMSVLEGGIGIFPRRLMVHSDDFTDAAETLRDNGIEVYDGP